jgi:hypothetical protein
MAYAYANQVSSFVFGSRLVVILVGRMRLPVSKAIQAYERLVRVIPTKPAKDEDEKEHNTKAFRSVFLEVLKDAGFGQDDPMVDTEGMKV